MAGIGRYLRQVREQQGYSLEEMNRLTNIHTEYLHALENDQFELLPSPFYAKAFLRTYAKCLGLDAQPLLEMYERLVQADAPAAPVAPAASASEPERSRSQAAPALQPQAPSHAAHTRSAGDFAAPQGHVRGTFQPAVHGQAVYPAGQPAEPAPAPVHQSTQRFHTLAGQTQKMQTASGQTRLPLPNPSLSQTLAPRRAVMEAKQSLEQTAKKAGKSAPVVVSVAVAALLLVGVGFYVFAGDSDAPAAGNEQTQQVPDDGGSVNASGVTEPVLEPGETSENEYEGQLYYLSNAKQLEIVLKGDEGESVVYYAPTYKDEKKQFTLRVGQEFKLDTFGKDEIWFRLSVPSNVDVTINGLELPTDAQDTEQSYRIKLKK